MEIKRSSGLIFHPTSLPSNFGIGDLGKSSYEFIDLLSSSGTKIWQVLPLGITDNIEYSPYSSKSSVLGNPYIVSLENLENDILQMEDIEVFKELPRNYVDYANVYKLKNDLFEKLAKKVNINEKSYENFLENEDIRKHITFITISEAQKKDWNYWEKEYEEFSDNLFELVVKKYPKIINKNVFLQYEFNNQWQSLKKYANKKNISVLGDIPIYVNHNSADVWLNKSLFDLDENNKMGFVSGAVPDDFTEDGQVWNTALYDWDKHLKENYQYWVSKLNTNLEKYDLLRIDHFIGFFKFWAIPNGESALNGHWRSGPWDTFFKSISNKVDFSKLLAEDLGVVLKETDQILNDYNIPGMKVLQQRIPNNDEHNEVHPKHWKENVVAYTGTHDSPTVKQWLSESEEQQIMFYKNYLNNLNISNESDVWNFIELTWRTPSILAVTNVQDILELDIEARFNLPGTQKDNWKWRVESLDALQEGLNKLKKLNEDTYRLNTLT